MPVHILQASGIICGSVREGPFIALFAMKGPSTGGPEGSSSETGAAEERGQELNRRGGEPEGFALTRNPAS